jgi:dipeptidase E
MGETRETRIKEFHRFNNIPVLGLREGSWLELKNDTIELKGPFAARLFEQNKPAIELNIGKIKIN